MEFVIESNTNKNGVVAYWENGWQRVFEALEPLKAEDLRKTVLIRGEEHTVIQAINRQLMHYANHIGQIVFLAKHFRSSEWKSLSIPRESVGGVYCVACSPGRRECQEEVIIRNGLVIFFSVLAIEL